MSILHIKDIKAGDKFLEEFHGSVAHFVAGRDASVGGEGWSVTATRDSGSSAGEPVDFFRSLDCPDHLAPRLYRTPSAS